MASNNQNQNWTAATFTSQGLPAPAGTNENGEPYWIIDGNQISWQQMQQVVWQQKQNQNSSGSGSGFEGMPNMVNMNFETPTNPESSPERISNPERSVEKSVETSVEKAIEQSESNSDAGSNKQVAKQNPPSSLIGDSAPMQKVKPNDPRSMYAYYQQNAKNTDVKSSNAFLKEVFRKILSQLASGNIGK